MRHNIELIPRYKIEHGADSISLKHREIATVIIVAVLLIGSPKIYSQHNDLYSIEENSVTGYIEVFIMSAEDISVYLYINYSLDPPAILLELPLEPATEDLDIVSGNALSAIYVGSGFALIMINSSSGSAVIRYRAVADSFDDTAITNIRSPSWSSYTDVYVRRGLTDNSLNSSINFSGEIYALSGSYLVYRLTPNTSIEIPLHREHGGSFDYKVIAVAVGAILTVILTTTVRSFSKKSSLEELDSVDREILRIIKSLGGEATMSRIMDNASIPRTTLWRRVRKLSKLGYVEVIKIGRSSLIRIRKARRNS